MVKVGSRNIILVLLITLLISSCEKEPLLTINKQTKVTTQEKKTKTIKKKRKKKLFKIFRKKVGG
jgi:hypothetical protein